jgi:DNA-binding transcriptional regulator YdaS (Cro superfamily)
MHPRPETPLDRAVQKAGNQAAIAVLCEVTPQAVNQWVQSGRPPARHVLKIEEATGISRHLLRPDVFGAAQ